MASSSEQSVKTEPTMPSSSSTEQCTTMKSDLDMTPKQEEETFEQFYSEVKAIEKRDSVLTPEQQIDRLLRPGATYFNLNPFEVLQIDPSTPFEEISKHYRRLSMLVHPDKNPTMTERASLAFEAINKAYKMLEDEKERKKCLEVVDEARDRVEKMCVFYVELFLSVKFIQEKRLKYKNQPIEEDSPEGYKKSLWSVTCKLFADIERLRVREEANKAEERKRKAEETTEREERLKLRKEWDKNYEESRETRVNSWKSFQKVAKSKESMKGKTTTYGKQRKRIRIVKRKMIMIDRPKIRIRSR
nr:EOG090X0DLG [Ilyocryptus agilis]